MSFETFKRSDANVRTNSLPVATVTYQKLQRFGLSVKAIRLINSPRYVRFSYDPERKAIGLTPTSKEDPEAYSVTPTVHMVCAVAFIQNVNPPVEVGTHYIAHMEGECLVVELTQPYPKV